MSLSPPGFQGVQDIPKSAGDNMSDIENKIEQMGFKLPPACAFPKPNRTGCVLAGNRLLVSGHSRDLPLLPRVKRSGKLGQEVTIEQRYATASVVALSILASRAKWSS